MKKNLGMFFGLPSWGMGAVLLALCAFTPVSRADVYLLSFTSTSGPSIVGSGQIDVSGGVAISPSSFSFTVGPGGTWILTPGSGISPSGNFAYDSVVNVGSDPFLDGSGLLFTLGGNEINIFGLGAGSYGFDSYISGTLNPISFGTALLTPVPEPINYALAAFALIFVGGSASRFYLGRRRSAMAS